MNLLKGLAFQSVQEFLVKTNTYLMARQAKTAMRGFPKILFGFAFQERVEARDRANRKELKVGNTFFADFAT